MISYLIFRTASFIWQRLPLVWGYALAGAMADVTYYLWPRGRRWAKVAMARVLGEGASPSQVSRLARGSFRNYAKYMVDFLRFPRLKREDVERLVRFDDWEGLDQALAAGKGAIFISLHMGNFDLAGAAMAQHSYPVSAIVEKLPSPRINEAVQRARQGMGVRVVPMESAARSILQVLRRNGILALLIDRPAPDNGVPVNLFGTPTRFPGGAATLALKTGAQVVVGALVRLPDNTFLGLVEHLLPGHSSGDWAQDLQALTQRIVSSLEEWVRQYPDQWYVFRPLWVEES